MNNALEIMDILRGKQFNSGTRDFNFNNTFFVQIENQLRSQCLRIMAIFLIIQIQFHLLNIRFGHPSILMFGRLNLRVRCFMNMLFFVQTQTPGLEAASRKSLKQQILHQHKIKLTGYLLINLCDSMFDVPCLHIYLYIIINLTNINSMFVSPTNSKRFNLYHLEQKQIYIQDFYGRCSFFDLSTHEPKVDDKGKFYLCSKSIIYESDNKNTPLMKYRYESFKQVPAFSQQSIKFTISRVTMIKAAANSPPEPFKILEDLKQVIEIKPTYEKIKNLQEWIMFLYDNVRQKNNYDMEEKIYEMIIQKFNKTAFNMSLIESVSQKPVMQETSILTRRVLPLNHIYGYIFITTQKVYFEPFHNISAKSVSKIDIQKIGKLFKRRYELRNIGLEIITDKSYYFTFDNEQHRNQIFNILSKRVPSNCIKLESLQKITFMWQMKQISNYEYLMHLNQAGNRSLSDLSQYPVFPWVLQDYESETIDLEDEKVYRDLSLPVGALNPTRLAQFIQRYENMDAPKFMYGSHYSTPGYVIGYLVRQKPQYMLKLQSGRFDKPDRLFKSIKDDWRNVYQNPTSVKQLIPEFYQSDTLFLRNYQNLDLGVRQNKKRVGDVKMPKWAESNPDKFLEIMRKALESDYVSNNLHKWIDLIFGYKQRGQQAIKAYNVFFHLTYEGMVDIQSIKDPIQKIALKDQINEFGQCPKQIFIIPHPPRSCTTIQRPIKFEFETDKAENSFRTEETIDKKSSKNQQNYDDDNENEEDNYKSGMHDYSPPPFKPSNNNKIQSSSLYSNGYPKVKTVLAMGKESDVKHYQIAKAHKNQITCAVHLQTKPNSLLTVGQDGFLKIFDVYEKVCIKSFKICDFVLSSIAMLKQDETFAIGSWDNNIYLFNIVYGSKSKPFPAHDNSISDLIYMPRRKKIYTGSWDCSVKSFRYVGNIIDSEQQIWDHDNQISTIATNSDESILSLGDIEGNILSINIDEKEQIYCLNMNTQRINRLRFIENHLVAASETQIRIVDLSGGLLSSYFVDKNNGTITDIHVDGQHLFIITSNKQLVLFDILQQKKIGNYFNDFTQYAKDRLPEEKSLTCVTTGNDGLFVAVGGSSGSLYILRS